MPESTVGTAATEAPPGTPAETIATEAPPGPTVEAAATEAPFAAATETVAAEPPPSAAGPATTLQASPVNVAESATWLEVEVNGQEPGTALLLRDPDGHLWARAEDLQLWRLPLPRGEPRIDNGEAFYSLDALPGLKYQIDEATQAVAISAPAALFAETVIDQRASPLATPEPASPGGFFNYDVVTLRTANNDTGEARTTTTGLFEAGTFNRWGTGAVSFLRSDLPDGAKLVRLDAAWTADRPQARASLRIGDSISRAGSWGGALRFGGIQYSTDFTTQPGFVSSPLAGLRGEAVLPSTVDLYVNNTLRLRTSVPPGPFAINDLPLISGQGEARLVVRDIMGREQLISVPYYSSPALLRPGISSFSYEIGLARHNYGLASNDYGRSLAIGTHRLGFTDTFTGEAHAELLSDQQTIGLGGVWLARGIGLFSGALSGSRAARGTGELLQLGFERQWNALSLGASLRLATDKYVQVGMLPTETAPERVLQGFGSFRAPYRGSISFNYIQQNYRDRTPIRLLSAQASWPVSRTGFLSISALKPLGGTGGATVGINLIYALGLRTSVSAVASRQGARGQEQVQMQQNLPAGRGFGYRVAVGAASTDPREATLSYQNDVGTYELRAETVTSRSDVSAEAQGGIAMLDGERYLSRRLDQSFAVVHVADYQNVRVYADNHEIAKTDSRGRALVPRIRAYQRNPLRIEQADLPLDAEISTLEKDAVAARRSGVRVDFDVKPSAGALVALVLENGEPVPAGAVVRIVGSEAGFPVGLRGESYVTGLAELSRLLVSWAGQVCEVTVAFAATNDPLPTLGPYVCSGVPP